MTGFQLKKIAFTLSLSAALTAHAAGLGTMTSSSKLGEPLNAEIELLAVTPGELNGIQAALASEQVYQDQSLEKPASYPFIKIEVANNSKGVPVLKLSSSQPITEAFLDMLIQVDWPTGRLVKEYTLLLDPPGFQSNYVSEPVTLPATPANSAPVQSATAPERPKVSESPKSVEQPANAEIPPAQPAQSSQPKVSKKNAEPVADSTASDHKTEQGDTLYEIARQMRPDTVSVEQMLVGLYQANPQAFAGKNMNRLKVGKILRMPDQATLNRLSQQQARSLVAAQTSDWQHYKNTLAQVVQQSPESRAAANNQQSAGKIGSAQSKPLPSANAAKDVLKLSAGDEKSTAQADKAAQKSLQDKVSALQEDLTAKDNAIKEEKSRTASLEKQIADMKKLLALKSDAMAKMQQDAAEQQKPAQPAATSLQTPEVSAPAAKAAEPAAAPEQAAPKAEPAEKPSAVAVPAEPVAEQHPSFILSLIQRLKQMNPALPFALIALPLLGCAWLIMRVRRKKQMHSFEEGIVTSPATEFQNNTVFGNTQVASGDTSFLTDFSQSAVGGMIDAHDVDPIAEAEVYMAYGRDAQAEEILKDAIQKDPSRQELKLKLLEIYHAAENMAAYETLASELYAKAGPNDPSWPKVVAMGQKLDPSNPLYRSPASSSNVESTPAADADNVMAEEEGYHLNFEAPALEFDSSENDRNSVTMSPIVMAEASAANEAVTADSAAGTPKRSEDQTPVNATAPVENAGLSAPDETIAVADSVLERSGDVEANAEPVRTTTAEILNNDKTGSIASELEDDTDKEDNPGVQTMPAWGDGVSSLDTLQVDAQSMGSADVELTPKSLDLPTLDFDVADVEDKNIGAPALNLPGESTLSPNDAVFESLPDLSFELGTATPSAEDSTGDTASTSGMMLEEISLEAAQQQLDEASAQALPEVEAFPEISLDVAPAEPLVEAATEAESEEVDTKLDLIKAYIDMEDVIGAKELIEEVLQEGGESQRKRANELLAQLA